MALRLREVTVIKAATVHQGNVHVLVLVDNRIQYHLCPVGWFKKKSPTELELAWPPPLQETVVVQKSDDVAHCREHVMVTKL